MKSGIYIIRNKTSNKVYIGQSVDVKRRLSTHKSLLERGKHENDYLQKSFNKDGIENFEFKLIELCNKSELDYKERYWIKYYDSMNRDKGYNMESGGNENKEFSQDRIDSITGKGNPMFGKHHSNKAKESIMKANRGHNNKLTELEVAEIKEKLFLGHEVNKLANEYNVAKSTISKINKCINWSWVREDLNSKLLNKDETFKKEVIKLYNEGNSITKICSIYNKDNRTIKNIVKDLFDKKESERLNRNDKLIKDFDAGLSKNEIIKKYNISNTTYIRLTREAFNKKKIALINKAKELKSKGMLNKDIAKELNIHRTTVTEYLKK